MEFSRTQILVAVVYVHVFNYNLLMIRHGILNEVLKPKMSTVMNCEDVATTDNFM